MQRFRLLKIVTVTILIMSVGLTACKHDTKEVISNAGYEEIHWGYSGDTAPEYWYKLSSEYEIAKDGKEQSPINIVVDQTKDGEDKEVPEIHYISTEFTMINNGHTIELIPNSSDNYILIDNEKYELQQLHFHSLSEHQINGEHTDMEVHLVHKDGNGDVAVIGILITEGEENRAFKEVFLELPGEITKEEDPVLIEGKINLEEILPVGGNTYQYDGSLTTPPCTEGVKWIVFDTFMDFSAEQINNFKEIYSNNYRPVQNLNNRDVFVCGAE